MYGFIKSRWFVKSTKYNKNEKSENEKIMAEQERGKENMRTIIREFIHEIARVKGKKISKSSMVTKLPRLMCDKMWETTTSLKSFDRDTIVDAAVSIFIDTMERQQGSNETFVYCKGYTAGKLMSWMERFVDVINDEIDGNFDRLRVLRDNVILPIFKAESIRANLEYWNENKWKKGKDETK